MDVQEPLWGPVSGLVLRLVGPKEYHEQPGATLCTPCREAMPHIRKIAEHSQGPPLVLLSVSLDSDEQKWKDFVARNGMAWP